MICPSPMRFGKDLAAYHERFADYFKDRRKSLKQHDVICFTRSGYSVRETQIATGYSYDFILDTQRRFAHLCTIKAIKEITNEHPDATKRREQHKTNPASHRPSKSAAKARSKDR